MNPTSFVTARQKSLDAYAESRRRMGFGWHVGGPREQGFKEGFTYGVTYGMQLVRSQQAAFVPSEGLARANDPANSKAAAEGVKVKALYDLITRSLRDAGSGTAQDIANRLGLPLNTVSPRFAYLKRNGICYVSGGVRVGRSYRSIYAIGNGHVPA